jgi:hypothetical protein
MGVRHRVLGAERWRQLAELLGPLAAGARGNASSSDACGGEAEEEGAGAAVSAEVMRGRAWWAQVFFSHSFRCPYVAVDEGLVEGGGCAIAQEALCRARQGGVVNAGAESSGGGGDDAGVGGCDAGDRNFLLESFVADGENVIRTAGQNEEEEVAWRCVVAAHAVGPAHPYCRGGLRWLCARARRALSRLGDRCCTHIVEPIICPWRFVVLLRCR